MNCRKKKKQAQIEILLVISGQLPGRVAGLILFLILWKGILILFSRKWRILGPISEEPCLQLGTGEVYWTVWIRWPGHTSPMAVQGFSSPWCTVHPDAIKL